MTIFDELLVKIKELEEEIKKESDPNDWIFVADKIKKWAFHCESHNRNNKCNVLIYNIQKMYNITKNGYIIRKKWVLELIEPVKTELIRLTKNN